MPAAAATAWSQHWEGRKGCDSGAGAAAIDSWMILPWDMGRIIPQMPHCVISSVG